MTSGLRPNDQTGGENPNPKDGLQRSQNELPSQDGNPDQTTLSLDSLKAKINDRHRRCVSMGRSLIDYAREAGEALIELKSRVGHGNFEPWLNQNLTCSNRQARRYMSVAQDWAEIKACMENEGPLSLTDAVDKPKAKSVVHDRFETPAEDEAWIAEEVRKADEEESSSIPGQIKELPIDSDPEVDPRLKEKYREIRQRFATLEKTLLPQVGDYLHALSQLIPPKGRRKQGGFPQQAWEDALETIYGAVTAWKPRDHCPHCKLAGCDQCGGLGWLRKRQR